METNRVQLAGRLTFDPDTRATSGGQVTSFKMAVRGQSGAETGFFRIVCWDALATWVKDTLHKGVEVYVDGRLVSRQFIDKDGVKKEVVEVYAADVRLCKIDLSASVSETRPLPVEQLGEVFK